MPATKYIDRLKRMDELIRRKATGNPAQFAMRMRMSKSMLMIYMGEMRKLGAQISYCPDRQTYQYNMPCELHFGFRQLTNGEMRMKEGGYFPTLFLSPIILEWQPAGL